MKSLTFLFLFLVGTTLFAQEYSVFYYEIRDADYFHIDSSVNTSMQVVTAEDLRLIEEKAIAVGDQLKTFSFESVLRIDGEHSLYYPLKSFKNDTIESYVEYGSAKLAYIRRESVNRKYSTVYMNLAEEIKISAEFNYGQKFLIEDHLESLDWQFTDERKNIGGYHCKKAIIKLQEGIPIKNSVAYLEDYQPLLTEVWYTDEIPVSMGPMGLSGLPGLILEVKNTQVHVVFKEISTSLDKAEIKPPTKGKLITRSNYNDIPMRLFHDH